MAEPLRGDGVEGSGSRNERRLEVMEHSRGKKHIARKSLFS